jgi:hypothetical protein
VVFFSPASTNVVEEEAPLLQSSVIITPEEDVLEEYYGCVSRNDLMKGLETLKLSLLSTRFMLFLFFAVRIIAMIFSM